MGFLGTMTGIVRKDSPMSILPPPNGQPLVDLAVLQELELQVQDQAVVLAFVHEFVDLWESRYARLAQALDPLDLEIALDVLLSIKTAAAMAGAVRLSEDAGALNDTVKTGDAAAAIVLLPKLESCAQQTLQELSDVYIKPLEQC